METTESTKPLDAYELIKLVADTVEYIGRMSHFYTTVLQPKYSWMFALYGNVTITFPDTGDIKVRYCEDSDSWIISPYRKIKEFYGLPGAKAEVLKVIAGMIKDNYYVCVGLGGSFEPDLHPPYVAGQAGRLYLIEVAQAYEKALLNYAKNN